MEPLSLAAGLSWGSGLRLYLTVLIVGVLQRVGAIHLPDTLSFLASPWVIGVAAALTILEFLADKIPAFDSLWDALHTFIRIPAGALLAAGSLGHADPALLTVAALAGGTLAGTAHLAKAGTRALINLSPEPVSNVVTSGAEDGITFVGVLLALFVPFLFLILLACFLLVAAWALPRLWRGVQGGFRGMATHMVSRFGSLRSRHD
ncbi:DUF4126 domain-containing protein [Paraburkholderia caballeronis]|uniref:DUF4126 domain-containing protein n=1 Tax=Paraburkholderia caballeronis TaxID=416943 RepID=A0A1H7T830_9BURK|nr:DUF4126 domain-containing protein [Paraburkholderia caballeronis]PXW22678.1 uncharacterized protein DUF4126 [Paraburkholderia caballeronis]PXW96781.1 uncharacterized protein DUF4126 [Paraburkholderia caballeronis]RAJ93408.1 uncharacterized protein DUF4126 [Paraburkholderia caballeronis]TDV12133.1 uncharacterized protein DUF4126 [Paraburkholderia caballeronis]TDV15208.1 uncharacterized protein DUF4126 [Paraburkholderia caballeronis]